MCALITVMAMAAFHLLSLKHLVTPFSWRCKFLPRLITHMACRCYWACSRALSDTHVHVYTCTYAHMHVWHAPLHANAHANHLHWSMAAGNDQAACSNDKVRKDQVVAVLSGGMSWAQLAAIPIGYIQASLQRPPHLRCQNSVHIK